MTEEEAKKKWCPMVRLIATQESIQPVYNRAANESPINLTACIASDCMMWRSHFEDTLKFNGYCGLGGKP